jgi:dTMP kinase
MAAMQDRRARQRGRYIALDGIDGCGKSTQAARLVGALSAAAGARPLHVREPGGTAVGEGIRALVLGRDHALSPAVETLLFAAARRQMLDEVVAPALAAGRDVVCERSNASTFAYQAIAGELAEEEVLGLLTRWAGTPAPDLLLWLDLPVEMALARRGAPTDRIEDKGADFLRRVAAGFARWAELMPGTVRVDASADEDAVAARVLAAARGLAEVQRG